MTRTPAISRRSAPPPQTPPATAQPGAAAGAAAATKPQRPALPSRPPVEKDNRSLAGQRFFDRIASMTSPKLVPSKDTSWPTAATDQGPRRLGFGAVSAPRPSPATPRRLPEPSPSEVSAKLAQLAKASPAEVLRQADHLLKSMGFDTGLISHVEGLGFRVRQKTEAEERDRSDGVTHPHDPLDFPGREVPPGHPGRPVIVLSKDIMEGLREFVATRGRGFNGGSEMARALKTVFHEMTHATLIQALKSKPAWAQAEMERIQREHGASPALAERILQESAGYYMGGRVYPWVMAAARVQRSEDHVEAEQMFNIDMGLNRRQPVDGFVNGQPFKDALSAQARRELDHLTPSVGDSMSLGWP